jgi:hypothetical protein
MVKEHSRTQHSRYHYLQLSSAALFRNYFSSLYGRKPRDELQGWSEKQRGRDKKVSNCSMKNELGRIQRKRCRRHVRYIPGICLEGV